MGPRASHGTGRPLLHRHLRRLEAAGLVTGTLEVAEDGKTVKYYDVTPFFHELTPRVVAQAAATLTDTTETDRTTGRSAKEEAK
ncbi:MULTISPECIES: ArsR/SmtB family transcription factor [Streptomyces]|uniref:ArsR/SmtB family transcription factor n=1 Tax=Streptomyces TaxID=1883 RepID=UPI0035C8CA0C